MIAELSRQQWELVEQLRETWLAIGLKTEPCNRPEFETVRNVRHIGLLELSV